MHDIFIARRCLVQYAGHGTGLDALDSESVKDVLILKLDATTRCANTIAKPRSDGSSGNQQKLVLNHTIL